MKKNEKSLNWRLSELPTAGEVAELVDSGVITVEEAREILFNEGAASDAKIKALEEQVDFLQGLVKTLSQNRNNTTVVSPWTYTRTISTPQVYWSDTRRVLTDSGFSMSTGSTPTTSDITMSVSNRNTQQ